MIYTHDEAARIIDLFENVLSQYNIVIPSPEDDERDADDMIGLYGSTYSNLLDEIEELLLSILSKTCTQTEIIPYYFSGNY